ncbi:MAG TPA: DUF488 domain-containing protein [Salinimicrobium sp.]|nr:DUF488 domain-containing protein [Salinimicrobium sp.]
MFYRRKIIFALLEKFEEGLERTRLQKLIFLLTKMQKKPNYDFVPYRYGCYSYSLKADLEAMTKHNWLTIAEKKYTLNINKKYFKELTSSDQEIVSKAFDLYGNMKTDAITKHTYINFPFYAINSIIAKNILQEKFYNRVLDAQSKDNSGVLFTLGYEGISLEEYLNKLIKNNIKILVDVRRNPQSQKYGFSKKLLSGFCRRLGIGYVHIPEVGIDSSKRRELKSQADYDQLFLEYTQTVLKETDKDQEHILQLLKENKRIALTCFEAENCQCHRTHLAEKISTYPEFLNRVVHL